jgi:NET1-associated nuclear protein 1 (U3 small nucleolar RNA-associated protein 17)
MLQTKVGKNRKKKLDSSSIVCLESNLTKFSEENPENPFGLSVCNYERDGKSPILDGPYCSVVVVGFPSSLLVFMEKTSESGTTVSAPFVWNLSSSNKISTLAIAPNKKDIACGHMRGTIQVLVDLIPRVEEYNDKMARYEAQLTNESLINDKKPHHPSKGIVVRKFHWHAHPVSTLTFDNISKSAGDSMLYSGAEESVIVTWQLSRGSDKPAEVLPRIALAGIVHMVSSHQSGEADSLLVYCADNSLHLFETHNQHLKWKVQGLGAGDNRTIFSVSPKLMLDPSSMGFSNPKIFCAGLAKAAGNIQTYDVRQQEVTATLQVAPFNRVSRMKYSQSQMPAPTIIHAEWDATAKRLLTVDTVPTENSAIGVSEQLEDGTMIGTVSTIRFWKFKENSLAFDPCAAMASPHGPRARLSSAALSADGKYACTLSNDEKAFRLWRRSTREEGDDWNCTYRIQFPSGYSNASSGPSALSFSSDSSVLAIGFGNVVTLWDRHNVTLLTSLRHGEGDEIVETVSFVQSGELEGMLLIQSSSSIALQSPYANKGIASKDWVWRAPSADWAIRSITPLAGLVSVILIDSTTNKSRVVLLGLKTGLQLEEQVIMMYDDEIVGLVGGSSQRLSNGWDDEDVSKTVLYTLFKSGEITCINMDNNEGVDMEYIPQPSGKAPAKMVTTLGLHLVGVKPAKRPANVLTVTDLNGPSKRKKLSIENFGAFIGEEATAAMLPKLTGSFVRAFVSRNLMKSEQ